MKKITQNHMTVFCFLGFLAVCTAASILKPQQAFSRSENRYLQKKPEFTLSEFLNGDYREDYEAYLGDQFPLRDQWIGVKVLSERIQGQQDVNGVYFGRDGYLIEKFDTEDIEGEQLDKNVEKLVSFLEGARETLGEERVKVMMIPTASQVLSAKLPQLAAPYDQKLVTEQIEAALGQETVIPLEEQLVEHEQEALYYKTDHHWTALGAYYGYCAWAKSMEMTPWAQSQFEIRTVSENFLGTVYSKVNLPHKPDSIQLYLPKAPVSYEIYYDGAEVQSQLYTEKALEGKDQYAVYMDGNHGLTEVKNPNADLSADRKLLIIKDSFANSFTPFAINHYQETYMIDLRYFNQNPGEFMKERGITDLLVMYQIPGFAAEKTVSKLQLPQK